MLVGDATKLRYTPMTELRDVKNENQKNVLDAQLNTTNSSTSSASSPTLE